MFSCILALDLAVLSVKHDRLNADEDFKKAIERASMVRDALRRAHRARTLGKRARILWQGTSTGTVHDQPYHVLDGNIMAYKRAKAIASRTKRR